MEDRDKDNQFPLFNPRPKGEPVNSYVFRIAPQREPDYTKVQRLIIESAKLITLPKRQD